MHSVLSTALTLASAKLFQSWEVFHFGCNTNASSSLASTEISCNTEPYNSLYLYFSNNNNSLCSATEEDVSICTQFIQAFFREYFMLKAPKTSITQ